MKTLFHNSLLAAVALLFALPALAQYPFPVDSEQVGASVADDADTVFLCKFVGTDSASGTIEVEADGDIVFKQGASGSEVADTTLECPVSAPLGGIIDVSNAACDTFGEVANIINASSDWVCAGPIDALASDGANDTLLLTAEAAATSPDGMALLADTSVALEIGRALTDKRVLSDYLNGGVAGTDLQDNPHAGSRAALLHGYTLSTYGSGDSFFTCYSVLQSYGASDALTETATTIFTQANAATATAKSFDANVLGPIGLLGKRSEKVLCQIDNSAALGTATLVVNGLKFDVD